MEVLEEAYTFIRPTIAETASDAVSISYTGAGRIIAWCHVELPWKNNTNVSYTRGPCQLHKRTRLSAVAYTNTVDTDFVTAVLSKEGALGR